MNAVEIERLFEEWARDEGLSLDLYPLPDHKYLWPSTENAWIGFIACAEALHRSLA